MSRIEDYALLSDCKRAALVSRDGAIDWLCLPRFDSPACFAALLGDEKNGTWKISPKDSFVAKRKYRTDSMILESTFENVSHTVGHFIAQKIVDDQYRKFFCGAHDYPTFRFANCSFKYFSLAARISAETGLTM